MFCSVSALHDQPCHRSTNKLSSENTRSCTVIPPAALAEEPILYFGFLRLLDDRCRLALARARLRGFLGPFVRDSQPRRRSQTAIAAHCLASRPRSGTAVPSRQCGGATFPAGTAFPCAPPHPHYTSQRAARPRDGDSPVGLQFPAALARRRPESPAECGRAACWER